MSVFPHGPDLLHLRGPREGEQGFLWSLHDLQQAGLQTSFPRHLVSITTCAVSNLVHYCNISMWASGLMMNLLFKALSNLFLGIKLPLLTREGIVEAVWVFFFSAFWGI